MISLLFPWNDFAITGYASADFWYNSRCFQSHIDTPNHRKTLDERRTKIVMAGLQPELGSTGKEQVICGHERKHCRNGETSTSKKKKHENLKMERVEDGGGMFTRECKGYGGFSFWQNQQRLDMVAIVRQRTHCTFFAFSQMRSSPDRLCVIVLLLLCTYYSCLHHCLVSFMQAGWAWKRKKNE